jgi:hypothetical protein
VTVPLTLLPSVGCTTAIAFNGADGFSVAAWARAMLDVSGKNISVINETGSEFILAFLFRRTGVFQPSGWESYFIRFSLLAKVIRQLSPSALSIAGSLVGLVTINPDRFIETKKGRRKGGAEGVSAFLKSRLQSRLHGDLRIEQL